MHARILCLAAALSAAALAAPPAAAAQRTFVASFGNDANPCSILSPCRGIARALTQTDAGGEVTVLDSAGYGAFTISQSVAIIVPDGVYAGISVFPGATDNTSHGIVVNGAGIRVALRGLTLNGRGGDDGIRIENAGNVFIEKVTIAGTGNDVLDAGIRVAPAAVVSGVFVSDTAVRGTAGAGVWIQANTTAQVDRCRIEDNERGGIRAESAGGRLTVSDSVVANNRNVGIFATTNAPGTREVDVARSIVDGNGLQGIFVGFGAGHTYRATVTDNLVRRNGAAGILLLANAGETAAMLVGNNRVSGNGGGGIACSASAATATLVAERNEVLRNLTGLEQGEPCALRSAGNNLVEGNGTDVSVGVTTVPLR